jgi:IS5 family transposase
MKQTTLAGFEKYGKTTRRAQFLADMDRVIPWTELAAAVQSAYPKVSESGGRPPIPLERMLRIYFLQLWFNLSDPAVEEALYDSVAMRAFAGIDLGVEGAPDETTVCKFRHLLERNKLGKVLLSAVNEHLHRSGIKIAKGTIVERRYRRVDEEPGRPARSGDQAAKGKQWYFGMKARGVDSHTGLIHTVLSGGQRYDREALPAGCTARRRGSGVTGLPGSDGRHPVAPQAKDFTRATVPRSDHEVEKAKNRNKSRVRAKVEHVFGVIKNIFGFRKVRYRGLAKNLNRLEVTAALANLYLVRRRLLKA